MAARLADDRVGTHGLAAVTSNDVDEVGPASQHLALPAAIDSAIDADAVEDVAGDDDQESELLADLDGDRDGDDAGFYDDALEVLE